MLECSYFLITSARQRITKGCGCNGHFRPSPSKRKTYLTAKDVVPYSLIGVLWNQLYTNIVGLNIDKGNFVNNGVELIYKVNHPLLDIYYKLSRTFINLNPGYLSLYSFKLILRKWNINMFLFRGWRLFLKYRKQSWVYIFLNLNTPRKIHYPY